MDTIPGGKLEPVGNLIDLPLDLEWTNVAGTQLIAGQAESYVSGGEWERVGHPQSPCVSALPVGGGCGLSPTLFRSLGTSGLQLETLMALPSKGRAGVGSRVCTGTGLGPWCSGGGNSVHTQPTGGNGSSCADPPGSMPGGTV